MESSFLNMLYVSYSRPPAVLYGQTRVATTEPVFGSLSLVLPYRLFSLSSSSPLSARTWYISCVLDMLLVSGRKICFRQKKLSCGLLFSVHFILARCAYRVAELKDGYNGEIITHEIPFIIFEGVFIVVAAIALCFGHLGVAFICIKYKSQHYNKQLCPSCRTTILSFSKAYYIINLNLALLLSIIYIYAQQALPYLLLSIIRLELLQLPLKLKSYRLACLYV